MAIESAAAEVVEQLYRSDWSRVVATIIRLTGQFGIAEDAAQDSFTAAVAEWGISGVPRNPRAWLIETARNKAIDRIRRESRGAEKLRELALLQPQTQGVEATETDVIPDDQLRLIFTCCHPALAPEAQIALSLRVLCGLTTAEIARAFLVPEATVAQRIVRAKRKIEEAGIPYQVPDRSKMPERLDVVLNVIYLVFTEGYSATSGDDLIRTDLCSEAIRLGRLLRELMQPDAPAEVTGLLALMLLHDARRDARESGDGELILLDGQDRTRWNRAQIEEAVSLVTEALRRGTSRFAVEAAIAAVHSEALRPEDTDWVQIAQLYDVLIRISPSPVVALNRAVAIAMVDGAEAGLRLIEEVAETGTLDRYHLLHAARADMLRRLGLRDEAAQSYRYALDLCSNGHERKFLEQRLKEMLFSV